MATQIQGAKIVVEENTTMIKPKFHPGCIVQSYNN